MIGRRRIVSLSLCGLFVTAAACGGADAPADPSSTRTTTGDASAGPTGVEEQARIAVGGEPIGIAVGEGSIWVVNSEFGSGGEPTVSRIDPSTDSVVATIPVGKVPLQVLVAGGSVWVSNSGGATVSRIDPTTDSVVATIEVCRAPEGLAFAAGSVWVVCEGSDEVGRIDPSSDRMVSTVKVGQEPRFAAVAFGSVWVSNYLGTSVSRIDPSKERVIATVETDLGGQVMAAVGGSLWISSVDLFTVMEIDPGTNEVTRVIDDVGDYPDGLLASGDQLWIASDLGPELRRLDPAAGTVAGPWVVGEQGTINANQLVVEAEGSLWLPLLESSEVVRIAVPV